MSFAFLSLEFLFCLQILSFILFYRILTLNMNKRNIEISHILDILKVIMCSVVEYTEYVVDQKCNKCSSENK